ncbi:MAG TPA: hypothetical protein VJ579_03240 [Candidatus Paceibacterota bacterium]|nr:hypothetical protein [Candidatus Paceibacterota bacterium]
MCCNSDTLGSVRRPLQLPANPEAWDGIDRADLVDECEGCGLAKGPTVVPADLVDRSVNPEEVETPDEVASVDTKGDPWSHLNGLPETCTCKS